MKWLLLLSLTGCPATPIAGLRRMGAARLEACIRDHTCYFKPYCYAEARAFCAAHHAELTCAYGEPEGMRCGNE